MTLLHILADLVFDTSAFIIYKRYFGEQGRKLESLIVGNYQFVVRNDDFRKIQFNKYNTDLNCYIIQEIIGVEQFKEEFVNIITAIKLTYKL
jgi:hypothetical protein